MNLISYVVQLLPAQVSLTKKLFTERYYLKKNSGKYNFTDQTIQNLKDEKRQIEDKESSNSYEMEAVEFLDHINFDDGDFDYNAIDNKAESI